MSYRKKNFHCMYVHAHPARENEVTGKTPSDVNIEAERDFSFLFFEIQIQTDIKLQLPVWTSRQRLG